MSEHLLLKWGTLKGWKAESEAAVAALRKYADFGMSYGCAQQRDTPEQKLALCDLIDAIDGEIQNDWTGDMLTKDEAKAYVMEYGNPALSPAAVMPTSPGDHQNHIGPAFSASSGTDTVGAEDLKS